MSNILLLTLNGLTVGGVIAVVGTMLVCLFRAFLLTDPPVDVENWESDSPAIATTNF